MDPDSKYYGLQIVGIFMIVLIFAALVFIFGN